MKRWMIAVLMIALATVACGGMLAPAAAPAGYSGNPPTAQSAVGSGPQPAAPAAALTQFVPMDGAGHGRFANDALQPQTVAVTQCYRPWQAVNPDRNGSKNATWIALICDPEASSPDSISVTFVEPWKLQVSGQGQFSFVLVRDLRAVEQLKARNEFKADPYDVSVAGDWSHQSNTLSVYWSGSGKVLDSKGSWNEMMQSFYQVPFEKQFSGGWIFHFDFGQGGNATIWIGSTEYVEGTKTLHSLFDLPMK